MPKRPAQKDRVDLGGLKLLVPKEFTGVAEGIGALFGMGRKLIQSINAGGVKIAASVSKDGETQIGVAIGEDEEEIEENADTGPASTAQIPHTAERANDGAADRKRSKARSRAATRRKPAR